MTPSTLNKGDRATEWFVPRFGPRRFRTFAGLLFLPYTGMVLSFSVIGSILAPAVHYGRVGAIVLIYFLGLGVAAHALDALGSKGVKPWGEVFSVRQLWVTAIAALVSAYGIAAYFIILYVPWLLVVAVIEGFFVFAYNLEWFGGRFHTDGWFAFSWGFLPVIAGYVMQTNGLGSSVVIVGIAMALLSLVEIRASRPYKELKRRGGVLSSSDKWTIARYESILKCVSLGVILLGFGLFIWRLTSSVM